ncbi:ABC transporter ATP-binding protein [Paenibacillus darwinianus]|uniref:ABC transporter ATP-binding protein n=1 Tax=Paenibacillus darwinianus TaxID=1380763 RepID=UPI000446BDB9|nr:ABC transporter ATP-binding protein [Paenibacillus darwinianus]EXX84776.1 sulfonate ABC transporter ATP-binding protein [Paenibacillus darwinianus]EXX86083.1 sulfonate ABC transporter ATP-binding protein [Paenibacillus darwinianus]
MSTEIVINQVNMRFGKGDKAVTALSDINLDIPSGEIVSLLGPSGCGKSTLLRLIADLLEPSAGKIEVENESPRQARLQRKFGIIFQQPTLLEWRNVVDNVSLPLEFTGHSRKERKQIAMEQLRMVGLEKFAGHYPWQLSGGMQQRVAIARALTFNPPMLLMDEPFSALDEFTKERLHLEVIRIQEQTRKTVVFVTHSIPEAVFLSNRVIVLSAHPGKVKHNLSIELPGKRDLQIREHPAFFEYTTKVRSCFGEGAYDEDLLV